jgi:two-component system, OmpR family, phosphate regulon sensor histidine kinase PhoR
MKLSFLWDEEKTRKLFRTHLVLFSIGAFVGLFYSIFTAFDPALKPIIVAVPTIFVVTIPFYILTLNRPNPGVRFFIFSLQSQLAASVFMAVTGGFLGIVQFAPYMFLVFTLFELGSSAASLLGIFSCLTFVAIFIWTSVLSPQPNALQDFLYYGVSYGLIVAVARNLGNEISIQVDAKNRLEEVDDLKNQFITLTSHYLRTPLTVIKGLTGELNKQTLPTDPQRKNIEGIETNVNELETLIEKFITISTIEKGKARIAPQTKDFGAFIKDTIAQIEPKARLQGVSIVATVPTTPINYTFDPYKLKDAVLVILDNAIKFNKPGGQVKVFVVSEQKDVKLIITDTGIGMKPEKIKDLFTSFNKGSITEALTTGKHGGIGIGLYLAKLIIDAHDGKIDVVSTVGQGSTFTITLPI